MAALVVAAVMDHPRIRGEHPGIIRDRECGKRIIPAYAGSTDFSPSTSAVAADHPRIRGEHVAATHHILALNGSSPHTRGALDLLEILPFDDGIIPAYAGSTR